MREKYFDLMANPGRIEEVLQAGAAKARKLATPFMAELREAVGLRNLSVAVSQDKAAGKKAKGRAPASSASATTVVSASACWRPMAPRCCCRGLSPIPRKPGSACVGCRKPCRMSCCKSGG